VAQAVIRRPLTNKPGFDSRPTAAEFSYKERQGLLRHPTEPSVFAPHSRKCFSTNL